MSEPLLEKPPFKWSFSQWENYNGCPQRWKFKSRLKIPGSPPGPAAKRGLEIHDSVERYIKSEIGESQLHPAVSRKFIPILDEFRNHPGGDRHTEYKMGFDAEWHLCGATSKYASCIAVLDAARYSKDVRTVDYPQVPLGVLHIGEWKSGKPKDTHADQRKLYALFGMKGWLADRVEVTTYYLEDTAPPQRLVLASESGYQKLIALWNDRISTMQRDEICAPRPSYQCNWCDYAKSKGGPCQFG